ncbi:MAG: STAS domain-containing protein, partial [Armatimonadota bacterium]
METEIQVKDEIVRVCISGELDAHTAPQLKEQVASALHEGGRWVVVNLEETEFIDSSGLGTLVGIGKRAGQKSGDIAVVCDAAHLLRVFDISGTRELLNVVTGTPDAEKL